MAKPDYGWNPNELRQLSEYIMNVWNPYKPYTKKEPDWLQEVLLDRRPQNWTFRDTTVRVETAIRIPYRVWYPNVETPDPGQSGHWPPYAMQEQLLVGYVGAGGW